MIPESQLAYEMAVCVGNVDVRHSVAQRGFPNMLKALLKLDTVQVEVRQNCSIVFFALGHG